MRRSADAGRRLPAGSRSTRRGIEAGRSGRDRTSGHRVEPGSDGRRHRNRRTEPVCLVGRRPTPSVPRPGDPASTDPSQMPPCRVAGSTRGRDDPMPKCHRPARRPRSPRHRSSRPPHRSRRPGPRPTRPHPAEPTAPDRHRPRPTETQWTPSRTITGAALTCLTCTAPRRSGRQVTVDRPAACRSSGARPSAPIRRLRLPLQQQIPLPKQDRQHHSQSRRPTRSAAAPAAV